MACMCCHGSNAFLWLNVKAVSIPPDCTECCTEYLKLVFKNESLGGGADS